MKYTMQTIACEPGYHGAPPMNNRELSALRCAAAILNRYGMNGIADVLGRIETNERAKR